VAVVEHLVEARSACATAVALFAQGPAAREAGYRLLLQNACDPRYGQIDMSNRSGYKKVWSVKQGTKDEEKEYAQQIVAVVRLDPVC